MRKNKSDITARQTQGNTNFVPPRPTVLSAVGRLTGDASASQVEALYDESGKVRSLTAVGGGLIAGVATDSRAFCNNFLQQPDVKSALGLQRASIVDGSTEEFAMLTRVEYNQVAKHADVKDPIPVRGGSVHVFLDNTGAIIQVNNTVRIGTKPKTLGTIISQDEAVAAAKKKMRRSGAKVGACRLALSAHEGKMDPVYEILLWNDRPRKIVFYLVHAKTGEVLHVENRLRNSQISNGRRGPRLPVKVKSKVLFRIPDYKTPISKQMHDAVIDDLPDAKVLKNDRLIMKVKKGSSWTNVRAAADGTFNFASGTDEAMAVINFFALNEQLKLMESWGMKKQAKPITVFVNDPSVEDNAYFDQMTYTIHIGIGSGIDKGGLAKYIGFDIGVEWHENGHHIVYLMTPGQDLPGSQGGGIHESTGDTLGDLLMDYWMRNKYQEVLGKFTKDDIKNDPRIIGVYAMYPGGIRVQLNDKKTPQDETGEPHDDGLISGGATADLLVAMATADDVTIEQGLEQYGRLYLTALTLVPVHKVMFRDLLRAFITADQTLNNGAFRKLIESCFNRHGITLTPPKRKKSPSGKGKGGKKGKAGEGRRKAA